MIHILLFLILIIKMIMIFLNKIESQADKHLFQNSSHSQIRITANECIKLNQIDLVTLI
jgi:hypothetical protein